MAEFVQLAIIADIMNDCTASRISKSILAMVQELKELDEAMDYVQDF